ncbi:MAG: HD domain-containing protein [Lachnospiraceae bacterium]|nr:HD domain-containing protein [Lachnospiraceae bacterium]
MNKKRVEDLKENEIIASEVSDVNEKMLLAAGTVLTKELIQKLKEKNIVYVKVQEPIKRTPEQEKKKQETDEDLQKNVRNILGRHTYRNKKDLEKLSATADTIIENITEEKEVVEQVYEMKERKPDLYEHSVNVSSMAIIMGLHLGMNHAQVHDLGVASLLHDLGLRYMTVPYENREIDQFSELEREEYYKHPLYAYNVLQSATWISEYAKSMIMNHHEKLDGSGYPYGTRNLGTGERILNLLEEFDEMVCGIANKPSRVFECVEYLKRFKNKKFDGKMIDAFLELFVNYPVGTKVRLTNGNIGVVSEVNEDKPDRPVVRLLSNAAGSPINNMELDLSKEARIYIEDVLDVEDKGDN